MATPAVGLFMMNLFNGSAIGLLALSAFLKVAAGLWLAKEMSTVDGRCVQLSLFGFGTLLKKKLLRSTLLAQRDAAKAK
eukprot:COSAG04_NODE_1420_length_6837_cov_13.629564_7_plen_79_part_00